MKVLVAEKCGFCLGVKNAINMAKKTLADRDVVYSLGSIIHNQDVVNELASDGLETVESVDQIESGTVLIRSHGATKDQLEAIKEKELEIVDATCVLVKRLQKISQSLNQDGYKVAMIGDENHPEVQAIVGFSDDIVVIGSSDDLEKLSSHEKLGIICQTTQTPEYFGEMLANIVKKGFSELKVINTLCKEAIKRQESAVKLCRQVDIMFVLGGLHSANTRKLAELCKKYNNQTFHLQNWDELDKTVLSGKGIAGVTAGASTPDRVISEFVENLKAYKGSEK
ncbi:MAG: 4-hydroxy-3-methylbut-2-enyl diphosphate reductase [Planctomycetes bacterium]|nr:4-hydroxy-3-methylbut-2-enyl diphosphate reductase [Planctomycetota bacterium]